jgi:hypothetical protein
VGIWKKKKIFYARWRFVARQRGERGGRGARHMGAARARGAGREHLGARAFGDAGAGAGAGAGAARVVCWVSLPPLSGRAIGWGFCCGDVSSADAAAGVWRCHAGGAGRSRIPPGLSNCCPARSAFATADASADCGGGVVGYGQSGGGQRSTAAARNWDGHMAKWVLIF